MRSDRFDARNPISVSPEVDPLTQTQYGASLGGKLIKDKTFFFSNFEQTRRNDTSIITISPANVTAINNRLNTINFQGPRIETGFVGGGYDTTSFFGRVDNNLNQKNLLYFTYNFYDLSAKNARTVGGLNSVSRGTNLKNRDHTFNGSWVSTIGPHSINEFRAQYRKSNLDAPPNDTVGPAVNIAGVASFGIATFSPLARDINLFQISNGFTTSIGNHSIKFGGEFLHNKVDIFFPGALEGVYNFNPVTVTVPRIVGCDPASPTNDPNITLVLTALQSFSPSCGRAPFYSQFQQAFGETSQLQENPNVALYIQDEWKPRNDLTLNLGLRYDAQYLPDPIQTDSNNFAPRFGLAYAPGDRKTVFRVSAGLYYERIPLRATSNALQRDGSKYIVVLLSRTAAGAPVFPNVLSAAPSVLTTKPNITRIDPEIGSARSQQANIQIERQLPFEASVSIGYLYLRGLNLLMSRNANVPRPVGCTGPNLCRPDPNFGNIGRFESSGDSYYNGLIVSFNKRSGRLGSVRASYTFSKAIDNAGNFFFSTPQDNFNLRDDRGRSDNDQRHRFTLNGSIDTPRFENGTARAILSGFQFSYIFTYASRLPFNILTGNDRNGDTNFNDRPLGVGRNAGRGFDFASLDLRLNRRFKFTEKIGLELILEGFNVLNRANYTVPNNVFGTGTTPLASFGRPTAAFDARQVQLGIRLNF